MNLDGLLDHSPNGIIDEVTGQNTYINYESVDSLKRRMSTRKKLEKIDKEIYSQKTNATNDTDQTMIRAHAMLNQLRNERTVQVTRPHSRIDEDDNNSNTNVADPAHNEESILQDADTNNNDDMNNLTT